MTSSDTLGIFNRHRCTVSSLLSQITAIWTKHDFSGFERSVHICFCHRRHFAWVECYHLCQEGFVLSSMFFRQLAASCKSCWSGFCEILTKDVSLGKAVPIKFWKSLTTTQGYGVGVLVLAWSRSLIWRRLRLRALSVSSGLLCNFVAVHLTSVHFILQLELCLYTIMHLLLEEFKISLHS